MIPFPDKINSVLVTGGSGFIGSHLVKKILRETNPFINPDLLGSTKILMEKMIESQKINYLNIRLPGIVGYQINDPRRPWLCKILNKLKNGEHVEIFNSEKNFNNIIDSYEIYKFLNYLILKKKFKSGSINFSSSKTFKLCKFSIDIIYWYYYDYSK